MPLSDIITATEAILSGIEGVGNVYSYRRWAADEASFKKLFVANGMILAWTITRESTDAEEEEESAHDFHIIVIRGWMGVKDANNTEAAFQDLVELIRSTFGPNDTLYVDGAANAEHAHRMTVRKVDYVKYGEYLCHYAEIAMKVVDVVAE